MLIFLSFQRNQCKGIIPIPFKGIGTGSWKILYSYSHTHIILRVIQMFSDKTPSKKNKVLRILAAYLKWVSYTPNLYNSFRDIRHWKILRIIDPSHIYLYTHKHTHIQNWILYDMILVQCFIVRIFLKLI